MQIMEQSNLFPYFSLNFSLEEQVLTRFEEENGGQIVIATVCLLETSRHGLLETELLQMLAEESTLTPRPYIEGESDQITVTKVEQTEAGVFDFRHLLLSFLSPTDSSPQLGSFSDTMTMTWFRFLGALLDLNRTHT